MSDERSPSGQPIYRHENEAAPRHSSGDPELIAAVEAHMAEHLGAPSATWHEEDSPFVDVRVHVVAPTDQRPVFTLVTSGMAELPMQTPDGPRFAELVMALPPTWPEVDGDEFRRTQGDWPFTLLRDLAQLPHQFETALGPGHTVPNGDPPLPYAPGTKLCCALLVPPLLAPDGFETLRMPDREIEFLAVMPLHRDEMEIKLRDGGDSLYGLIDEAQLTEVLEPGRPSVVRRRRWPFRR